MVGRLSHWSNEPQTTLTVLPVSTSYTQPLIVTLSGTNLVFLRYCTSAFTASVNSGNARKSNPRDFNSAVASDLYLSVRLRDHFQKQYPRFFSTKLWASSFLNVSMPHPVCLTSTISSVPSNCSEMMMLLSASCADAPAYAASVQFFCFLSS